jgi:SAM-dependent methyltransferase
MSGELAHWPGIARSWHLVGPPLRPSPEEIELFERSIMRWAQGAQQTKEIQALILGVTPELFLLRWPEAMVVRALDASSEMINAVWQGPKGSAVSGSWTAAPIADASQHVIVCDGGFGVLSYPHGQRALLAEASRMLAPGGIFIVRLFAPGGLTGSVSEIAADLNAGSIASLDSLKLRLWGALQTDLSIGVRPRDVVARIEDMAEETAGGLDYLVSGLGWSSDHVATLALHRRSDAVYHLTDADGLIAMAELSGFEPLAVESANSPFGNCCPVVSLRRR